MVNWIRGLACLLVAIALGLFIAALVTPWYRVHHKDGSDSRMGLYNSRTEYNNDHHHNKTASEEFISENELDEQDFPAETANSPLMNRPMYRLTSTSTSTVTADRDTDPYYDRYQPYQQRAQSLHYNDGWITAIRVLLIFSIVISFGLLLWTCYQAFITDTPYTYGDSPYITSASYIFLFLAFLNGIVILAIATSYGPSNHYDEGYAFNTIAFTLLLIALCTLCWPMPVPVLVAVPREPYGSYQPPFAGRPPAGAGFGPATGFAGDYGKQYGTVSSTTTSGTGTIPDE